MAETTDHPELPMEAEPAEAETETDALTTVTEKPDKDVAREEEAYDE